MKKTKTIKISQQAEDKLTDLRKNNYKYNLSSKVEEVINVDHEKYLNKYKIK